MIGKKHSEETKAKLSLAFKGEANPMFGKPRSVGAGKSSQQVEVFDIKNNVTIRYESISSAALALNIKHSIISIFFKRNQKSPYQGKYIFKKV